eukprot:13701435-Alexandrium_andersonii.AAC.1
MDQHVVNTYGFQMREAHARARREDARQDEIARCQLPSLKAFPYPNYYEPLACREPAQGQGGLDLGDSGSLDLDAL